MQKIRTVIDRFEGDKAVLRTNGDDVIVPKKYLKGFREGETVQILLASDKEDTEKNEEIARALLAHIFKE